MKRLLLIVIMLLPMFASAQTNINLEFVTSSNAYFTENQFDEVSFKMDRLRLEIKGNLNDKLSYHFRQAFNKSMVKNYVENLPPAVEYAYMTWKHNDLFKLVAGKQYVNYAGYECYLNALKVREFCDFNNAVNIYHTGVTAYITPNEDQEFSLQLTNSRYTKDSELYEYGLPEGVASTKIPFMSTFLWSGWFAEKSLHLMYSATAGHQAKGKNVFTFMGGHIYEKGPVVAYFDVMYSREGLDSQQRMTLLPGPGMPPVTACNAEYLSFVADFDYQFHPKWNAYVKGAYETAGIYEANGPFEKGKYLTSWNAQACLEWLPFTEAKGFKVFAHYVYHGYELTQNALALNAVKPHNQRISLGLVYTIPVL